MACALMLAERVRAFCVRNTQCTPAAFGRMAVGRSSLFAELEGGQEPSEADKVLIEAALSSAPGNHKTKLSKADFGQTIRKQRSDRAQSFIDEAAIQARRAIDPIELAKLYLRRRGRIVFAASVTEGPTARGWFIDRVRIRTGKELKARATAVGWVEA